MFFLNPRIISQSAGGCGDVADLNIAELKSIMKNLIIRERPQTTQAAVWAEAKIPKTADASTQTTQTSGGRVWLYGHKKKTKSVKTFSL